MSEMMQPREAEGRLATEKQRSGLNGVAVTLPGGARPQQKDAGLSPRTPEIVATEINTIKRNVRTMMMASAVEIGSRLEEAKGMVPRGRWTEYLAGLEYSERTAQNLMRLAAEYRDAPKALTDLSYTQAVLLLGVPEEQRETFVEDHDLDGMSTRELQTEVKRLQKELTKQQLTMDELTPKDSSSEAVEEPDYDAMAAKEAAEAEARAKELQAADQARKDAEAEAEKWKQAQQISEKRAANAEREVERLQSEPAAPPVDKAPMPPEVEEELKQLRVQAARSSAESELRAGFDVLRAAYDRLAQGLDKAADAPMTAKYRAAFGKALRVMAGQIEKEAAVQ